MISWVNYFWFASDFWWSVDQNGADSVSTPGGAHNSILSKREPIMKIKIMHRTHACFNVALKHFSRATMKTSVEIFHVAKSYNRTRFKGDSSAEFRISHRTYWLAAVVISFVIFEFALGLKRCNDNTMSQVLRTSTAGLWGLADRWRCEEITSRLWYSPRLEDHSTAPSPVAVESLRGNRASICAGDMPEYRNWLLE